MHSPFTQPPYSPSMMQTFPQSPQFCASVSGLTQSPMHSICGGGQSPSVLEESLSVRSVAELESVEPSALVEPSVSDTPVLELSEPSETIVWHTSSIHESPAMQRLSTVHSQPLCPTGQGSGLCSHAPSNSVEMSMKPLGIRMLAIYQTGAVDATRDPWVS